MIPYPWRFSPANESKMCKAAGESGRNRSKSCFTVAFRYIGFRLLCQSVPSNLVSLESLIPNVQQIEFKFQLTKHRIVDFILIAELHRGGTFYFTEFLRDLTIKLRGLGFELFCSIALIAGGCKACPVMLGNMLVDRTEFGLIVRSHIVELLHRAPDYLAPRALLFRILLVFSAQA